MRIVEKYLAVWPNGVTGVYAEKDAALTNVDKSTGIVFKIYIEFPEPEPQRICRITEVK